MINTAFAPAAASPLDRHFDRTPLRWRVLLWSVMSAVFTSMVIQYSFRDGRLVLPPAYDDVGYLADGAVRLVTFYQRGLLPAFQQYVRRPPHSPYSTVMAVIGFLVFGVRDWAPYAANAMLIFVYLAFADHLLRGLKLWEKLLAMIVLLTVPLTVMAAHEFRPDHACALLTVIGGMLILERPLLTASGRRLALIGAIFGLALLTKTTTFPATLAMLVGTLFLGTTIDVLIQWRKRRAPPWTLLRKTPRAWAICCGLAILIALPHFVVAWSAIYSYIYDNVFGYRKDIWRTAGSWSYQLFYYVDPGADNGGGGQMLGRHVLLLYLLVGLSAVVTLLRPRRRNILRAIAMLLFLGGTFFVVAVANKIKTTFFGLTFQTAFAYLGLAALRQMLMVQRFRTPRVPWATVVLIASVIIGFGEFRWPRRVGRYYEPESIARRDIAAGIYDTLLKADPSSRGKVLIEGLGDINPDLLTYYNARDQYSFEFVSAIDTDDLQTHLRALSDANFLILSESNTKITADFLLSYRVLDALNAEIRRRPNWTQLGYFVFPPSKRGIYVFQRELTEFAGWTDPVGLGPVEGPYPEMNLPTVRWGLGPATTLRFTAPPQPVELRLALRNDHPGQVVQIFLDDRSIFSQKYPRGPIAFQTVHLPLAVAPGTPHQIRIAYSQWYDSPDLKRAILFKELSVLPRD